MVPVKILVVLFSLVNMGQIFLMTGGKIGNNRLHRFLNAMHLDSGIYTGFIIAIIIFFILIFAIFAFFKHFINYKEHYSSFLRFLILANLFTSFLVVIFNFYLYFVRG